MWPDGRTDAHTEGLRDNQKNRSDEDNDRLSQICKYAEQQQQQQ
jgi:hypothetical protein